MEKVWESGHVWTGGDIGYEVGGPRGNLSYLKRVSENHSCLQHLEKSSIYLSFWFNKWVNIAIGYTHFSVSWFDIPVSYDPSVYERTF